MENITRMLDLKCPRRQSAFLWGARKTGKSTYLRQKFPDSLVYDFLKTDLFLEVTKNPSHFRQQLLAQDEEILKYPIILDEVQKVPQLLDEIHWLIENKDLQFILCGSSARKLKRGHANLLGGRAWRFELFPLVSQELGKIDLLRALNQGLIPDHYLQNQYKKSLRAYVQDYLKEEVFAEGLVRNIPAFSRFFEAMGYAHGQLVNYSNIARECAVDYKTVQEYYQILIDTLLGIRVEPYKKRQDRSVITRASKFYLFDVGVAGVLTKRSIVEPRGEEFGRAFEHFILMEITAYRSYSDKDFEIQFWRTKSGQEIDFILGQGEVAIEVKGSRMVDRKHLRALKTFSEKYHSKKNLCVCQEKQKRLHENISILPWQQFLDDLWSGRIL